MSDENKIVYKNDREVCSRLIDGHFPLIYLFKSDGYRFVFDLNTNRIFSLESKEYEVLDKWLKGIKLKDISKFYSKAISNIEDLQKKGLFCCKSPKGLAYGNDWQGIRDKILHERSRTVLELTEQCNLRCKYCTYGGGFKDHRTHSSRNMSEEIIKKSIISALNHGDRLDEISIGFYGGEPLYAFNLLKFAVLFAQKKSSGKKINFSITTNATVLDEPKARFLRNAGFSILVSIDGPKHMHNRYRVFPNGKGSYKETIKGLKILLDVYPPNLHDKIGLNMVVPSSEWIPYLEELWENEPWLPRTLRAQANIFDPPNGLSLPPSPSSSKLNKFTELWFSNIKDGVICQTTLGNALIGKSLVDLHHRPIFSGCRETFFPNGCCIPGAKKIYVRVDGTYQICERVHGVPTIGSVTERVDLSEIRKIINEYSRRSFQDCKDCWAISICGLCYLHAYENGSFNIDKKKRACIDMKKSLNLSLRYYGLISQEYSYKLDEWDNMKIK